jgi:hypothetical protein
MKVVVTVSVTVMVTVLVAVLVTVLVTVVVTVVVAVLVTVVMVVGTEFVEGQDDLMLFDVATAIGILTGSGCECRQGKPG